MLAAAAVAAPAGGRGSNLVLDQAASSTASLKDESTSTGLPADTVLTGAIQVIYLPDLDEQYVIKSKNLLAKSAFALAFRNGSELMEVDAEHDATTVTIALLSLVQQAIGSLRRSNRRRYKPMPRSRAPAEVFNARAAAPARSS